MNTCRIKTRLPGAGGHRDLQTGRQASRTGCGFRTSRTCLHVLAGRVDAPRICTRQFECYHCGFDQLLDDMDTAGQAGAWPAASTAAAGQREGGNHETFRKKTKTGSRLSGAGKRVYLDEGGRCQLSVV